MGVLKIFKSDASGVAEEESSGISPKAVGVCAFGQFYVDVNLHILPVPSAVIVAIRAYQRAVIPVRIQKTLIGIVGSMDTFLPPFLP